MSNHIEDILCDPCGQYIYNFDRWYLQLVKLGGGFNIYELGNEKTLEQWNNDNMKTKY